MSHIMGFLVNEKNKCSLTKTQNNFYNQAVVIIIL